MRDRVSRETEGEREGGRGLCCMFWLWFGVQSFCSQQEAVDKKLKDGVSRERKGKMERGKRMEEDQYIFWLLFIVHRKRLRSEGLS